MLRAPHIASTRTEGRHVELEQPSSCGPARLLAPAPSGNPPIQPVAPPSSYGEPYRFRARQVCHDAESHLRWMFGWSGRLSGHVEGREADVGSSSLRDPLKAA